MRILFADEARFGRINRPRPCWAPIGVRPEVASQLIREYIYLYGAVSPKDGTCVYLIMPRSDTACFQAFLNVLSRKFAGQDILLVLDGAPNYRCSDLALPGNISLLFLPPYSPELNPKENLWDEIREKIFKNYALKSIDAVRAKLKKAILYIERHPKTVKSITSFPYILKSPSCGIGMSQSFRAVLIRLVDLHLEGGACVPSIETNDFEPESAKFMHEPWRHRSGLDPYAGIIRRMPAHQNADLFWICGALAPPQSPTGVVDDANSCYLLRNIQSSKVRHQ